MQRDMDLIRDLLFLIRKQENPNAELKIPPELDRENVVYHLNLMEQAGLTKNNIKYASNKPFLIFSKLTWDGHDFLDSIKNDTIWNRTKDLIKSKGMEVGQVSFSVIKDFAKLKLKEMLGMDN